MTYFQKNYFLTFTIATQKFQTEHASWVFCRTPLKQKLNSFSYYLPGVSMVKLKNYTKIISQPTLLRMSHLIPWDLI